MSSEENYGDIDNFSYVEFKNLHNTSPSEVLSSLLALALTLARNKDSIALLTQHGLPVFSILISAVS